MEKTVEKSSQLEIQMLIEGAFNLTRTQYWTEKNETVDDKNGIKKFHRLMKRFLKGEPVAYILKKREFFSEMFYLNKNVLIPRPETEVLIERALELIRKPAEILDIGAGSGNISIILAKLTGSKVFAVEYSQKALYVLKKNIAFHDVRGKVIPVKADIFPGSGRKFDMIVSNPPYLSEGEWKNLPVSIKEFEPKQALVAGKRGTEIIHKIVRDSKKYMKHNGKILIEIGYGQKEEVEKIFKNSGFQKIEFFNDLSKIPRVVSGTP